MVAAAKLITQISKRNPSQLPRYQSPKSGMLFDRIVNKQNLELLRNPLLPAEARFPQVATFMEGANGINVAYLSGLVSQSTGDDEMTELSGLILRTSVVMIEWVDEFVPTLDPKNPTYAARMKGLDTMKSGLANVMQGSIQQISEPESWKPEPLGRFIAYMDETFPVIIKILTPNSRKETLLKLKKLSDHPSLGNNRPAFLEMMSKVITAAE